MFRDDRPATAEVHRAQPVPGDAWSAEAIAEQLFEAIAHDARVGDDARECDLLVPPLLDRIYDSTGRDYEWVLATFLSQLHGFFIDQFGWAPPELESGRFEVLLRLRGRWLCLTSYRTVRLAIRCSQRRATAARWN